MRNTTPCIDTLLYQLIVVNLQLPECFENQTWPSLNWLDIFVDIHGKIEVLDILLQVLGDDGPLKAGYGTLRSWSGSATTLIANLKLN